MKSRIWTSLSHLPPALLLVASLSGPALAGSITLELQLNTAVISAQPGHLAFSLADGNDHTGSSVVVANLAGNAVVGDLSLSGDASGGLAPGSLTLGDAAFYSEGLLALQFGNTLVFEFSLSPSFLPGEFPDQFSFFVLDEQFLPYPTDDPLGADALLVCELVGVIPDCRLFSSAAVGAVIEGFRIFDDRFEP